MKTVVRGQYVVMGVSGCGKSSVARLLASRTDGIFLDADDFHPPANKTKMAAAIPLTDEDRWPWLDTLNRELRRGRESDQPLFLACSALRQAHRERLAAGLPQLGFIYLKGSRELIRGRLQSRQSHFMPAVLLDSQFAALEEPDDALIAPVDLPLPAIVEAILSRLPERRAGQEAGGSV